MIMGLFLWPSYQVNMSGAFILKYLVFAFNPNRLGGMTILTKLLVLSLFMLGSASARAQIEGDVLTIGDSLTAGLVRTSRGRITCIPLGGAVIAANRQRTCIGSGQRNIGGWQPELSQSLGIGVFNYGNSGETTPEMLARLNSHLARTPSQFVLILGGTNDAIFGVPQAQTIANLSSMIDMVRNAGREPIVGTLPPLVGSVFRARNANVLRINEEIRTFENIQIADHYSLLIGSWAQNTSGDFIHLGTRGNRIVAQEWLRAINAALERDEPLTIAPIINLLMSEDN